MNVFRKIVGTRFVAQSCAHYYDEKAQVQSTTKCESITLARELLADNQGSVL